MESELTDRQQEALEKVYAYLMSLSKELLKPTGKKLKHYVIEPCILNDPCDNGTATTEGDHDGTGLRHFLSTNEQGQGR